MTQFAHDDPAFELPKQGEVTERRRAHAGEVMADLAGATAASLDALPQELPVEAAVACGNCRLYGGVAPQIMFPDWLATAAARRLATLLVQAADDADRLPELWADCTSDEAEDIVASLLHARMDAWAASLQLDDVAEHVDDDAIRSELEAAMDTFDIALERLDRAIDMRQDYLSTLAGTRLLSNLRGMLAPEYHDPLPWWLDGRLEAKAAEVDVAIDKFLDRLSIEAEAVVPTQGLLTFAQLRPMLAQTYAAAAALASGIDPAVTHRLRWRSPDGSAFAVLVPPITRKPVPDRIVLDITDASGRPALSLVALRCSFAGVDAEIKSRAVGGEDRAVASFPGDKIFGGADALGDTTVVLRVDSTDWMLDSSR